MSGTRHARLGVIVGAAIWAAVGCGGGSGEQDLGAGDDDESGVSDDGSVNTESGIDIDGGLDGSDCVPRTCAAVGANCGPVADGCGGLTADCGTCAAGQVCGGGGVPSVCGTTVGDGGGCVPLTCEKAGANCGPIGDGCGGVVDCGTCASGLSCGGGGTPSVCGVKYVPADGGMLGDGGSCIKKTCADYPGVNCGYISDGCGDVVNCGTCTVAGEICGAVTSNVCANPYADGGPGACIKKTCADYPGTCGAQSDGCGGLTSNCGTCTAPDICGGGGVPSKCGGGSTDGGVVPGCTDPLCAKIPICDAGTETSISGIVLAPNGKEPLYNAVVYIPKGTVAPFGDTVTCDRCDAPKPAIASAITGPDGKFTLKGAIPAGTNIPLVIELGKWRRYATIPTVSACKSNALAAALTRLPKKQHEGHALDNIPRMAITTGRVDALECVLRKMGIDDSAFGDPDLSAAGESKRIHFYMDNGATYSASTPSWTTLTADPAKLAKYDAVIWSCRGSEGDDRSSTDMKNLRGYADAGGRVFATHFSYMWIELDPVWKDSATWRRNGGSAMPGDTGLLRSDVNTSFSKGLAFSQWLQNVSALAVTSPPQVDIQVSRKDVIDTVSPAVKWISSPSSPVVQTVQHMTFNTPFKAATSALCGRVLFSDFHVANVSTDTSTRFPKECNSDPLTAQEKILEFMLFDLASCVNGDNLPPPPPPTCKPKTCADFAGSCGKVSDGCGGVTADCGACTVPGESCGGGGVPGKCGAPSCKPKNCAYYGATCGWVGDGCGDKVYCGDCTVSGETCGGGGVASTCGKPTTTPCTPMTCTDLSLKCGPAGDGCGGLLDCGTCVAPETCGGGGTPGVCGAPTCTPKTCAGLGYNCGLAADGCGGVLDCGKCATGSTCGGGGKDNVCSGGVH